MKIIEHTEARMVIKDSGWPFLVIAAFLVFIGIAALSGRVHINENISPFFLGGAFLLAALLIVLFASRTEIIFDKSLGKAHFEWKSLLHASVEEYPLDALESLELTSGYQTRHDASTGRLTSRKTFLLSLMIKERGAILLGPGSSGYRSLYDLGSAIAAFLNIPLHDRRDPTIFQTVRGMVNEIKKRDSGEGNGPSQT